MTADGDGGRGGKETESLCARRISPNMAGGVGMDGWLQNLLEQHGFLEILENIHRPMLDSYTHKYLGVSVHPKDL